MNLILLGYSGSGSSAIECLLREYRSCTAGKYRGFEHVLFYIPDGLFDLEDRLLRNNSLYMSDGAIRRFRNAMLRLNDNDFGWFGGYQKRMGGEFMKIVNEFTDSLIQYRGIGAWYDDFAVWSSAKSCAKDTLLLMKGEKFPFGFGKRVGPRKTDDGEILYSFVSPEYFYERAGIFVQKYCDLISEKTDAVFAINQLLLPQNIGRFRKYFPNHDTKMILVDRDPRDLFVLGKYIWPKLTGDNSHYAPIDADAYAGYHKAIRNIDFSQTDENDLLKLHFEDLSYRYEETVSKIEAFLGLDPADHIEKGKYLNVERVLKNTQNYRIKKEWAEEVAPFETMLKDYLYDFPMEISVSMDEVTDPT